MNLAINAIAKFKNKKWYLKNIKAGQYLESIANYLSLYLYWVFLNITTINTR